MPRLKTDEVSDVLQVVRVQELGFNLHAASVVGAEDQAARQRLVCYVLHPPLAKERLNLFPDNRGRLDLKRPFSDGTYALECYAARRNGR